ncbi:uncharacterized protein B0P05DRAFT_584312 [Gilbertella persicaria]|uniref:uncharacterized protein n=1 Tax=Gilbertella persicaria TaxID=101096 RepID=UPI00221F2306|nr:uncharacterized protein B0P05DRAFT_584312 [Gilbertella persicaria]KAI8090083.1 hypothetical protein B0P05DRAFT_584312 [Gilbertella persicaria]
MDKIDLCIGRFSYSQRLIGPLPPNLGSVSQYYYPPARLSAKIRQELAECFSNYIDDEELKKMKKVLFAMVLREEGAISRIIESLVSLLAQMTNQMGLLHEEKVEAILDAFLSPLFKTNGDYDPHRFDNKLFCTPTPS